MKFYDIRNTFKKHERLKREQHINTLFSQGKAFSVFPLRFVFRLVPVTDAPATNTEYSPVLAGFSVPKKKFKLSVHRHRVRRQMIEAWRVNKAPLCALVNAQQQLHVFVICTAPALPAYTDVLTAMTTGIGKLQAFCTPTSR